MIFVYCRHFFSSFVKIFEVYTIIKLNIDKITYRNYLLIAYRKLKYMDCAQKAPGMQRNTSR